MVISKTTTGGGLQVGMMLNAYNIYTSDSKDLPNGMYLGYLEACLVNFGIVDSKNNGLQDYVIKKRGKWGMINESREDCIVRLVGSYLQLHKLI